MSLLALYRALATAATPLVHWHLRRRVAVGKEDPARLPERLGYAGRARPPGALCWLHAASIGEAVSLLPVIVRLRRERPALTLLITTGTVTSARLLAERLPAGVIHQYVPVDLPAAARRFVAHWRPDLVLWSESELWPSLLGAVARRGTPLLLLNGRMSVRSYRRWRRLPGAIGMLFGSFQLCLGQTPQDAERFKTLGAPVVDCLGNLKFAAPVLPVDARVLEDMRAAMAGRVRWLAASTHPGEEESVATAHRLLAAGVPGLLTLLVPRHPARGAVIAAELRAAGLTVARRAAGETLTPATEVYLADTIGELGLWYRLAPVAFVGGSLVPRGGQNPLEPARLDVAVLHGPHMENFAEIAGGLAQAGGSRQVADAAALAALVRTLCIDDPAERAAMAAAARDYADSQALVLDRLLDRLAPWLDSLVAFQPADDCQAAEKYRH